MNYFDFLGIAKQKDTKESFIEFLILNGRTPQEAIEEASIWY